MNWQKQAFSEEYSLTDNSGIPCLLIPGWSFDSGIFEWLLPGLAQYFQVATAHLLGLPAGTTIEKLVDELAALIHEPAWLIGWSLGGNMAIELACRYPEKVLGLALIGTTPVFVESDDWLVGMPTGHFHKFRQGLPGNVEKSLHKFDLLQSKGDHAEKNLRHALLQYRAQQQPMPAADLALGLQLLGEIDQRAVLRQLQLPMLWCFGELDALVNAYTAYEVKALCPLADVQVFRHASHALFLTCPDKFFKALLALLNKDKAWLEKSRVAASFSRAAAGYDSSATLQRRVAERLLAEVEKTDGYLLDAGCGTGYWLQQLATKADVVVGLDMAHGMLQYGQATFAAMQHCVESDLESLPFADHSLSQIFSSFAVQWCASVGQLLEEWYRVLKPGGKAYIATLGENTLYELRESWLKVDAQRHVNTFLSVEALCEEIYQSPFQLKKMQEVDEVLAYDNVKELMRDLKNIGAQTVVQGDVKGLTGRQRFAALENAYESYRNEQGMLPATYEVVYLVLEKHL